MQSCIDLNFYNLWIRYLWDMRYVWFTHSCSLAYP